MTNSSRFVFSVPNNGAESKIIAEITCINSEFEESVYSWGPVWKTFSTNNVFTLKWDKEPPSTIILSDYEEPIINISIEPNNEALYTYDWVCSASNISVSGSSALIKLFFLQLGEFTTTVNVKNNCTGEIQTITKSTNVLN